MRNVLVADSGSTKTDWAYGDMIFSTQGINPFHQDDICILSILKEELLPKIDNIHVENIRFYGSGVRPEKEAQLCRLLSIAFPSALTIEAHSDILGAARALCGYEEGIACILGTGSNSCLYNGSDIVSNISPMGYILGDEGSGASLGKLFLNALYKKRLPNRIKVSFEEETGMDLSTIIDRVYRQPMAGRWLASLSPFIYRHINEEQVEEIVVENFICFIRHNILPYQRKDLPINALGSMAFYYKFQLEEAVKKEGCALGRVMRNPIESLIQMEQLR